jgi:hypothetical protein
MAETVQTVLKVDRRVREAFKRLAKMNGRTMSGEFSHLVAQEIQRRKAERKAAGNS